jgi:hypothetical protein
LIYSEGSQYKDKKSVGREVLPSALSDIMMTNVHAKTNLGYFCNVTTASASLLFIIRGSTTTSPSDLNGYYSIYGLVGSRQIVLSGDDKTAQVPRKFSDASMHGDVESNV